MTLGRVWSHFAFTEKGPSLIESKKSVSPPRSRDKDFRGNSRRDRRDCGRSFCFSRCNAVKPEGYSRDTQFFSRHFSFFFSFFLGRLLSLAFLAATRPREPRRQTTFVRYSATPINFKSVKGIQLFYSQPDARFLPRETLSASSSLRS